MTSGPSNKRPVSSKLPGGLEMLRRIANLQFPDEQVRGAESYITQELQDAVTSEAKKATNFFWPELWEEEWRGLKIVRDIRYLLRRFWSAKDERSRDWYVHQARAYYGRLMIQRELQKEWDEALGMPTKEEVAAELRWLFEETNRRLYEAPVPNRFETALINVQQRARKPSLAPKVCENENCPHPYFLRTKTLRRYCGKKCSDEAKRKSKRESWHSHKKDWRKG